MKIAAVVTGHSRGLGAAIASGLVMRGIPVLGLSRGRMPPMPDATARLEEVAIDLSDTESLRRWLVGDTLGEWVAGADQALLINNAGLLGPVGAPASHDLQIVTRTLAVNVVAPLLIAAAFARAAASVPDRRIVHLSSGAGRNAIAGWSVYCASKAALDHHARTVAADGVPGLRICSLAPGVVDTGMQEELRACSSRDFPLHAQFVDMKRKGALATPQSTANRFLDWLLGERFGSEPVGDLRDAR